MRFLVYFKVYEMLKDVHIVVLPVQVVRYLGFLEVEIIKANFLKKSLKCHLQDSYPGSQGNAQLFQPFLGKVGQLQHSNLCLLKDPRVLLVTQVLGKDACVRLKMGDLP